MIRKCVKCDKSAKCFFTALCIVFMHTKFIPISILRKTQMSCMISIQSSFTIIKMRQHNVFPIIDVTVLHHFLQNKKKSLNLNSYK